MGDGGVVASGLINYLDFKVFSLIRDRFEGVINAHRGSEEHLPIYKHIFMAPTDLARQRSFRISGVATPYVCVWPSSVAKWSDDFWYGKSVLPVDFAAGDEFRGSGYLYHLKRDYNFSAGSYFRSFVNDVNFNLLEVDRLRYFGVDVSEICEGYVTQLEFQLGGMNMTDVTDEGSSQRLFQLTATYAVDVSLPVVGKTVVWEGLRIWLEDWNRQWVMPVVGEVVGGGGVEIRDIGEDGPPVILETLDS